MVPLRRGRMQAWQSRACAGSGRLAGSSRPPPGLAMTLEEGVRDSSRGAGEGLLAGRDSGWIAGMTKALETAFEKLRRLPAERQDEIAEMLLDMAERPAGSTWLTDEQADEVRRSMRERDFLSEQEVEALYRKYGA